MYIHRHAEDSHNYDSRSASIVPITSISAGECVPHPLPMGDKPNVKCLFYLTVIVYSNNITLLVICRKQMKHESGLPLADQEIRLFEILAAEFDRPRISYHMSMQI